MKRIYQMTSDGLIETNNPSGDLIIYNQATLTDREYFLQKYDLPADVFNFHDMPSIAPRIEYLTSEKLGKTTIFVLANITENHKNLAVEERLESHTFILGNNQLFWFVNEGVSPLFEKVLVTDQHALDTLESIIMLAGLLSYKGFTQELREKKQTIDQLDYRSNHNTSNQLLIDVADTERDMVLLEHTLDSQELAFSSLLADEDFLVHLNNEDLTHDIHWYNRQVNKLVHLYRDLLTATSALYSDIMSNSLNKLMKFLSSLSLVLASSSLIAEFWGMNTGGLPGENSKYGTIIMLGLAFFTGLAMYFFLNKKDHSRD